MDTSPFPYKKHRFPPEIISHAVRLYHRFCLSFRDVEELLGSRGVVVSYETVRQWGLKFGPAFTQRLGHRQGRPGGNGIWMKWWSRWEANVTICGGRSIKTVRYWISCSRNAVTPGRRRRFFRRLFKRLTRISTSSPTTWQYRSLAVDS